MGYTKSRSQSRNGHSSRASTLETKDRLKLDPLMHHRQIFVLSLRRSLNPQGNCNWSDVRHHYKKASGRALNGEELNWIVKAAGKTRMDIFQGELSTLLRVVDAQGNVICPDLKNSALFVNPKNQKVKVTNQLEVEDVNDDTPSISEISPNPSLESETCEEIDVVGGIEGPESSGDSAIQSGSEDGNSIDKEPFIQITVDAPQEEIQGNVVEMQVNLKNENEAEYKVECVNVEREIEIGGTEMEETENEEIVVEIEANAVEKSLSTDHEIAEKIEYADTFEAKSQPIDFIERSDHIINDNVVDIVEKEDSDSIESEIIKIPIEVVKVENEENGKGIDKEIEKKYFDGYLDLPVVHASPAVVIEENEISEDKQQADYKEIPSIPIETIEDEIKVITQESEEYFGKAVVKEKLAEDFPENNLSEEVFEEFVKIYEQQEKNKMELKEVQWIAEQLKKEFERCLSPVSLSNLEKNDDKFSETDVSLIVCTTPSTLENASEAESAHKLDILSPTRELPSIELELDPGVQLPEKKSRKAKRVERAKSPRHRCAIL